MRSFADILRSRRACAHVGAACAAVLFGCADAAGPPSELPGDALSAKGGGGASFVAVSSAKPDTGSQGTTLDVTITGSGFTSDMDAMWELDGVADPSQVQTNSTRYVSSKQLVANITIGPEASPDRWDIRVQSRTCCKGGLGIEVFEVKIKPSTDTDSRVLIEFDDQVNVAVEGEPVVLRGAAIIGDGRDERGQPISAGTGRYQGNFCGVRGEVNHTLDMLFNTNIDYRSGSMASLCGTQRTLRFFFNYNTATGNRGTFAEYALGSTVDRVGDFGPGESRLQVIRFGRFNIKGCEALRFSPEFHPGASWGRVTRLSDGAGGVRRWRVESTHPHNAVCLATVKGSFVATNTLKYMPFAFVATEIPFPYPAFP